MTITTPRRKIISFEEVLSGKGIKVSKIRKGGEKQND